MTKKYFWLSLAVVLGFVGGFFLANALNRSELNSLRSENERLKRGGQQNDSILSTEEILAKIAEADQNPNNFSFQKNLGLALYQYGARTRDPELISETTRILQRASELNRDDYDVLVGAGNAWFDVGFYKKDNAAFETSRQFYRRALEKKADDVDVRTDLGLTYFLEVPPANDKAVEEFLASLRTNPKHEKTIQFLIQVLLRQGKSDEAAKYLEQLRQVNPNNESLPELSAQINQGKNAQN